MTQLWDIIKICNGKRKVFITDNLQKVNDKLRQLKKSGGCNRYEKKLSESSIKKAHVKNTESY